MQRAAPHVRMPSSIYLLQKIKPYLSTKHIPCWGTCRRGARELLKRGYDAATPYNMRHANSATLSFRHGTDRAYGGAERAGGTIDPLPEIRPV